MTKYIVTFIYQHHHHRIELGHISEEFARAMAEFIRKTPGVHHVELIHHID